MVIGRKLCLFIILFLTTFSSRKCVRYRAFEEVDDLVRQWAPLVWLAPGERYLPQNVEDFLQFVYVSDENGRQVMSYLDETISQYRSNRLNLVTHRSIESLQRDTNSFLHGNPNLTEVSIYALVRHCATPFRKADNDIIDNGNNLNFHVSYWIFYPFNLGKDVCVLGKVPAVKIFNTCLGHMVTLGNHVGDWEHVSLSFVGKNVPDKLYLATHTTGAFYTYSETQRVFKLDGSHKKGSIPEFPGILDTQGDHPIIFSANGSHGMWATQGDHKYLKVPKLVDSTGYGTPWKTWSNVKIFHIGYDNLPLWMNFKGKWGNPKSMCLLKKLGICEVSDGPTGIIRKKQDFYCFINM